MGEALGKIPKGDTSWVFVGASKQDRLKKKEITKEDTLFNKFLQDVFDVATPTALAERADVADVQGKIALSTAEVLTKKSNAWQRFKEHKDLKKYLLEQDVEWRGREVPERLRRILVFSLIGAGSFALNYGTNFAAEELLFKNKEIKLPFVKKPFELNNGTGNRAALLKGWEMISDMLVGKLFDYGAQLGTNKKNIGFVTPLTSTLAQVGNTVLNFADISIRPGMDHDEVKKVRKINALINPGVFEAGIRAVGAIPIIGIPFEKLYALANKQLLQEDGTFPFIFNLAYAMIMEKDINRDRPTDHGKGVVKDVEVDTQLTENKMVKKLGNTLAE
jgi:hypothetical protein